MEFPRGCVLSWVRCCWPPQVSFACFLRGGVFDTQRLVRRLWRMCFALFIATGSFLAGQDRKLFPSLLQSNLILIPAILPLILLIFWLIRVRFTNAYMGKLLAQWRRFLRADLALPEEP